MRGRPAPWVWRWAGGRGSLCGMVPLPVRERVDAYWCDTLAIDSVALHTPGVRAFPNPPQRLTWRGIYVLAMDKAATVFAPADLLPQVQGWVGDMDADSALDPAIWSNRLPGNVALIWGPGVHTYRDHADGLAEQAAGRRINPLDAQALGQLRGAIAPQEWSAAGFNAQAAMLFGLFEGDRLVAAANLTAGPDAATDVGIVVHPDERGRGHAVRIAAAAAKQAIAMHGIARFRALADSRSMLAIAETLGFSEYGRNLVVYLPR
jgi:GNAT superfamily N-acetyltransferase